MFYERVNLSNYISISIFCPTYKLTHLVQYIYFFLGPKNIWIIGSSIVHWARRNAFTRPGGQQLTLQNTGCNVFWLGQRGMTWDCLNKVVDKNVPELRLVKLIVIQLVSNDLGIKKTYELYSDIKLGLMKLKVMCPNARIV